MGEGSPATVCAAVSTSLLPPRDQRRQGHLWPGPLQVLYVPGDVAVVQPAQDS